ncbi:MAG: hypothetical protein IPJ48_16905 [Propionivibrio sp.]|uniref:Uncharacterized protein n=1 Tax=Candidatus Propionivibrio dominans TaxID=2954373 RepID=A0A9D7IDZ1_9RHOO|nr:hypothetical protein [Candidatus Propionivibrio dominans]
MLLRTALRINARGAPVGKNAYQRVISRAGQGLRVQGDDPSAARHLRLYAGPDSSDSPVREPRSIRCSWSRVLMGHERIGETTDSVFARDRR